MKKPTLKPLPGVERDGRLYGVAEHQDGDHTCHIPYATVKEGENIAGRNVAIVSKDDSYEMLGSNSRPCSGPPQVATKSFRQGWEQTFGVRGGVS